MTSKELALSIIHAAGGDPKRADEAASIIDAWVAEQKLARFEVLQLEAFVGYINNPVAR